MEVGLGEQTPTYSGGLGVLAGDTLKAAADAGLPMVAVTLLHRQGYFHQHLDGAGRQTEDPDCWNVAEHLREMEPRVVVELEGKTVTLRCWLHEVEGVLGARIPVFFLDAELADNEEAFRERDSATLLRGPGRLRRGDAPRDRSQWIVLQHRAHDQ